jgi:hypothetical protein
MGPEYRGAAVYDRPNYEATRRFLFVLLLASSTPAADDAKTWATAIATRPSDGRKIVYRFIQEYSPTFDRSKYPVRITLSWRYSSETGMPSVPERESMDELEDASSRQRSLP